MDQHYSFTFQHHSDGISVQVKNKSGVSVAHLGPLPRHLWKKSTAFAVGSAEIGLGIYAAACAVAPLFLTCAGAGLLASGVGSLYYAFKTPEENVDIKKFIRQSTISFIGGAVGGGIGRAVETIAAPAANLAAAAFSSISTTLASATTEAALKRDIKVLTPENVVKSLLIGLLTKGLVEEKETELMIDLIFKLEESKDDDIFNC